MESVEAAAAWPGAWIPIGSVDGGGGLITGFDSNLL